MFSPSQSFLACLLGTCPGKLPADLELQPQNLLINSQYLRADGNLKPPGQTACLSQAITFHLLTSVWSPIICVGIQASGLELAAAVAFGTETQWLSTLAGRGLRFSSSWICVAAASFLSSRYAFLLYVVQSLCNPCFLSEEVHPNCSKVSFQCPL